MQGEVTHRYKSWKLEREFPMDKLHSVELPRKYVTEDHTSDHPQMMIRYDIAEILDSCNVAMIESVRYSRLSSDLGGAYEYAVWGANIYFLDKKDAVEFRLKLE